MGPYVALKRYIDDYESSKDALGFSYDNFLFKTFSSRTEKFIIKTIIETYKSRFREFDQKVFNDFFFTMAVLFTRKGTHFRGSHNFDEKKSFEISYPFVAKQIEIVKPKVIMPIGSLGFRVIDRFFNLGYSQKTLSEVISELNSNNHTIKLTDTIIIPNFHPASHTSPKIQTEIWSKIWDYYN